MRLGRLSKTPSERKRYAIDYSQWLDTAEALSSFSFSVTPTTGVAPLTVEGAALNSAHNAISFFATGGDVGVQYVVDVIATTSGGQIKEDTILLSVRSPS